MDCIYEQGRTRTAAGMPAEYYFAEELDSTMEPAYLLAQNSGNAICILRTGHQRAGRGRKPGRAWDALPGENLLSTWAVPKELASPPLHAVPLRAGLAAARIVEQCVPELPVRLKWPNDVLISGKKVCGILCESKQTHVLIGIGLNVNRSAEASSGGKFTPTSLAAEAGRRFDIALLHRELTRLLLEELSSGTWRDSVESRLYGIGGCIRFSFGRDKAAAGLLEGIDSEGALLIREGSRLHRMYEGEILEAEPEAGLEK